MEPQSKFLFDFFIRVYGFSVKFGFKSSNFKWKKPDLYWKLKGPSKHLIGTAFGLYLNVSNY